MRKSGFQQFFAKFLIVFICFFLFGVALIHPVTIENSPTYSCSKTCAYSMPKIGEVIKSLFKRKKPETQTDKQEKVYVYVGGVPLGFTISCSGAVVVAISSDTAGDLKEGDVIIELEGNKVSGANEILSLINKPEYAGKTLTTVYTRKGEERKTQVTPIYDEIQKFYKLGLWIRDNAAGVGTLTYIRKDNLRFGALGHPVCDIDTGSMMPAGGGNIFKCNIVGCKKGVKGNAGELRGLFLRNGSVLGSLDVNSNFGVFGTFDENMVSNFGLEVLEVASRSEVKCGKAQIKCTVDGTTPKYYDIEIVKTYFQQAEANKSMFIRVTDPELLEKTGGIVQGMSGSPIIQNGKLVGAVTHVFVSDPSKGYGVYAEWMINN